MIDFKTFLSEAKSGDKEAYKKYFDGMLKKFGVKSPAELDDDKKKEFFAAVDKGWDGANESSIKEALKAGKGNSSIDIDIDTTDYDDDNGKGSFVKMANKEYKVKVKVGKSGDAIVSGKNADILKFLQSDYYGMDDEDIEDLFPELMESKNEAVEVDGRTKGYKEAISRMTAKKAKKENCGSKKHDEEEAEDDDDEEDD